MAITCLVIASPAPVYAKPDKDKGGHGDHGSSSSPAVFTEETVHTLRHTAAMHMLQAKTDTSLIALYLGHESPETTHQYVEADLAMKERALRAVQPPSHKPLRFKPSDRLLSFLTGL